jgi:hypothetical protein
MCAFKKTGLYGIVSHFRRGSVPYALLTVTGPTSGLQVLYV